jgi:hypothetical protein
LFFECTALKTNDTRGMNTTHSNHQFTETAHLFELEQENMRKKVKRLTGEMDALETYLESF